MDIDWNIHKYEDKDRGFTSFYFMATYGYAYGRGYYFHDDLTTWYISDLSVEVGQQGRGIGRMMLAMIEHYSCCINVTTIKLWVFKDTWQKAWYERNGYVETGVYDGEENAVWMEKKIVD